MFWTFCWIRNTFHIHPWHSYDSLYKSFTGPVSIWHITPKRNLMKSQFDSGSHITNELWYNLNRKYFCSNFIPNFHKWSLLSFAHATTAVLSGHAQNFVAIVYKNSDESWDQNELFLELILWRRVMSLVKRAPVATHYHKRKFLISYWTFLWRQ